MKTFSLGVAIWLMAIISFRQLAITVHNNYKVEGDLKVDKNVQDFVKNFSVKKLVEDEVARRKQEQLKAEIGERVQEEKERERDADKVVVSRGADKGVFIATAYDLSVASTNKKQSHPAYGITANGTNLKGHTLESARAIAVDPKVIKLGSKVYIEFLDEEYKHLNGEFTAVDTGGAIKGNKIDVFFGSGNVSDDIKQFGRRQVKITVLK